MTITANNVHKLLEKHILADGLKIVIDFDRSEGSWVYDKATNKKYLDCFGQFASLPLGYNHPSLIKHRERLTNAATCKIVNSDLYSCEYASFVKTFFNDALPEYFKYAFFIEGGSAAVENALKVAFDWKSKKAGLTDAFSQVLDVIHLREAFHGRGGYTMSLTNTGPLKVSHFPRFPWTRISNPKITFPMVIEDVMKVEEESLTQCESALKKGNVAAIVLEPVQGEGGNNIFRKEYFSKLRELANKYEALLIFDEVQTGFGVSGHWWCHQVYDVNPDIMVFGKKSQVCGIVATDRLDESKEHCFNTSGRINSTWGGNIVDMVRSDIIIKTIKDEKLIEATKDAGIHLLAKLREIEAVSGLVSNTRGVGTLIAFDLPDKQKRDLILTRLNKEMIILGCGEKSIRFRPALTFTKDDANTAVDIIRKALR